MTRIPMTEQQQRQAKDVRLFQVELSREDAAANRTCGSGEDIQDYLAAFWGRINAEAVLPWEDSAAGEKTQ